MSVTESYSQGLEGILAGETAVSTLAPGLIYRGYPVVELAERATYDEVAYLLLHDELPTAQQLADFQRRVGEARKLPACLYELFDSLPKKTLPMDSLRSAVSIMDHFDPDSANNSRTANLAKAERLLAQIPVAIAACYRISQGE